jgi:hypothetical protein
MTDDAVVAQLRTLATADLTYDICLRDHSSRHPAGGADGDNVGVRIAQELRRLDKLGTVGDRDELLESNLSRNIDRFLCLSLAAAG